MSITAVAAATPPAGRSALGRRALGLLVLAAGLVLAVALSLSVGARSIPVGHVWHLVFSPDDSDDSLIIHGLRLPRTELGLLVGAALGVAGGLMQAVTRNPLADPGLLGVNAGASAAIVTATATLGITAPLAGVWFAFLGAGIASIVVYGVGASGRSGATPVRLAIAGTAITFALTAYVRAVVLFDPTALDQFRFWQLGSLAGHPPSLTLDVLPFVAVGLLIALALARPLNAIALGEEQGRALGAHPGRTRALSALAITLLCGAATAAVGPIAFVGLAVPHVARAIAGPDQRWVLPYCALLAPLLLLGADVVGRIAERPSELEVGIVTAVLGAPVFIAIVRRRRIAQL